jgi:putative tricarboxylic transport membrane protein
MYYILDAAWQGLVGLFHVGPFLLLLLGMFLGNIVGILPGLGGQFLLAVLIPFCFGMDLYSGMALLLSAHAVTGTGGAITSILFNTPGEASTAVTCLDGFEMTKKGQAGRAMGAALYASGVGGVIGALALLLVIPVMRIIVLSFGPPEFFMLTVLGISFIGSLGVKSPVKGLICGLFGLLLSLFGEDPSTGVIRYSFGSLYLYEGMRQIPVVLGIFAVAEMIHLGVNGADVIDAKYLEVKDSVWDGIRDVHRHWWLTVKSSLIAVWIGFLPGLGGVASSFFTYGFAQRISKHPETFGHGNVEGVIAPEAANNAKEGGALIPTIGFGVPGSSGMAIILGAFLILGVTPGPKMLNQHLPVVFAMGWTLAIANVIGAAVTLVFAQWMAKAASVRSGILVPIILVFIAMGSYTASNSIGDLLVTLIFGILGYFTKVYDYPKAPFVLGLVLGRIAEGNFNLSYDLYGLGFITRPITFVIFLMVVWALADPIIKHYRKKREEVQA